MKTFGRLPYGVRWLGEAVLATLITTALAACGGDVTEPTSDEGDAEADSEMPLMIDGGPEGSVDVMTDGMPNFDGASEGGVMTDGMPMFDGASESGVDVMTDGMPMFDGASEGGELDSGIHEGGDHDGGGSHDH